MWCRRRMRMTIVGGALVPVSLWVLMSACDVSREPGAPARLVAQAGDTVVVNNRRPVTIPMQARDVSGMLVPASGVRFARLGGDSLDVSGDGVVTCARRGDATVRATAGTLTSTFVLRCRPVYTIQIPGPIQFVVGDTAMTIPVVALDADGAAVNELAGRISTQRRDVVAVEGGLRIRPLQAGVSLISVRVGDIEARVGAHVYEPVTTFDGLRPDQYLVRMSMRLASGEVRRWHIPAGQWMLTMMPYADVSNGLRLRVEGAVCMPARLTPRRMVCEAKQSATIIVYHPSTRGAPAQDGELLIRRVNS